MDTPLFGASALLIALATATYLAYSPQPPHQEPFHMARRARVVLFAGAFTSAFLLVPPVAAAVDEVSRQDGMGTLFFNLASGLTVLSMHLVTVYWTHPATRIRRAIASYICFFGAVMAVQVWEFRSVHASSAELFSATASSATADAFVLTHLGFLDVMAVAVSLQYAALAHATWPRWRVAAAGLAVTTLGGLLGLAYSLARTGAAIADLTGQPWPDAVETHVVPITGALAALFVTAGLTLPTVVQRIFLPHNQSVTGRAVKDDAVRRIALL
ncbi:hypothetical protein ACFXOD_38200 [Streptomyces sp. NPDC059161]|uniref:hypothetical protein n=1 Tax=Streptomyces sp. NPDC059161 TaxID=3346749 RepID=UPI003692169A